MKWFLKKNCLPKLLSIVGLAFCLAHPACADEQFEFEKKIELPSFSAHELIAIPLDTEVYQTVSGDFSDIRILNRQNEIVPYLHQLTTETKTESTRRFWTAKTVSAEPKADGSLEIHITLGEKDPEPNGLRLITPLRNYEHRVNVWSSDSNGEEQQVARDVLIFDYSRFIDVRNNEVPFSRTSGRSFRILVSDTTQAQSSQLMELTRQIENGNEKSRAERLKIKRRPFRIDHIEFWKESEETVPGTHTLQDYPPTNIHTEVDAAKKQTIVHFDSQREPLTELTLIAEDRNFSRQVHLQVQQERNGFEEWQTIASGTLSRMDFKNLQREELTLKFTESRAEHYRLIIENQDNPPLHVTGIQARGNLHRMIVLISPNNELRMIYGNPEAQLPVYDLKTIGELLKSGQKPLWASLEEAEPSDFSIASNESPWRRWLNDPWILGSLIVVLVLLLARALYRASQKIDAISE